VNFAVVAINPSITVLLATGMKNWIVSFLIEKDDFGN